METEGDSALVKWQITAVPTTILQENTNYSIHACRPGCAALVTAVPNFVQGKKQQKTDTKANKLTLDQIREKVTPAEQAHATHTHKYL